ncbi:terminase small subunit [Tardibacter chloracetimidivorans]|uniref:Terminase small subunit n=1 Tax=Tardibacter chloracetimidivorans TaxID=1921510 RepID=A0A1L3ZR29_9SPHN|nr:terminase small subunit [Tardibacter chloracetimidivorans]API58086.1 terminase small subunit [Tardibacter chloracetimidivorans]
MALTPKQEAFCLAYVETGNASEAYRRAYDASKSKPSTINVRASELLADSKIAGRVDELRAAQVERLGITVDDLIAELDEARLAALGAPKPQSAAAVSATLGKAKLLGLITDKIDQKVTEKRTVVLNFGVQPE